MSKLLDRIEREAGIPGLASILAERLAPTDFQSLLLEVYRLRAARVRPAAVLAEHGANRFTRPSTIPPARLLAWDQVAFANLPPGFEPLALAPVCPLGTVSAVAGLDQAWAVATARNTEVVSDSTNVLALEAASRRQALLRASPKSPVAVHLAASHRLLRAQHYDRPDLVAHFALFALCSAGRARGSLRFELETLALHAGFYLRALRAFLGPEVPLELAVTDFTPEPHRTAAIETGLLAPAADVCEGVTCRFDPERTGGRGYYDALCFHVYATAPDGRRLELADGGVVDWTQRLLSNAKERCVISGLGSERLCAEFPATQ